MQYSNPLYQTSLNSLPLVHRGKVRDIYAVEDEYLLIVTTDRLSAFDVVFPTPVPDKGRILTEVSNFWFKRTESIIPNQLTGIEASRFISDPDDLSILEGRTVVVRKLRALPVEAIVRGYLIGSGWKEYQQTGQVCGITLKSGLAMAEQLPEPIFTPSSKAELGEHDENISYADTEGLVGKDLAAEIRDISLKIYIDAAEYAYSKGIIIADTKFEFGVDQAGRLHLIDEVLTPDSSRFWPVESYRTGISPPSYDKQFVRDYLETLNWNKQPPAPELPELVLLQTSEKYRQVAKKLLAL
ncbi:MAG: phosphoribosylaminoimidazolesuccinocarboxamide synthase [Gammaproteobacteria bacterium]|nr:phosphoribosylaminoimidazolesuccinocarboxamide synthase [Gammaproteobacteria bacterium]